eukprot:8240559-Karenia_brevis.AAC.1
MKEDKRRSFARKFVSLGAQLELPRLGESNIVVDNKSGRIAAILELIEDANAGGLFQRRVQSIMGKAIYAEGQLFGRLSATFVSAATVAKGWLCKDLQ